MALDTARFAGLNSAMPSASPVASLLGSNGQLLSAGMPDFCNSAPSKAPSLLQGEFYGFVDGVSPISAGQLGFPATLLPPSPLLERLWPLNITARMQDSDADVSTHLEDFVGLADVLTWTPATSSNMAVDQNPVPLVNIKKNGGRWRFIHPKMEP